MFECLMMISCDGLCGSTRIIIPTLILFHEYFSLTNMKQTKFKKNSPSLYMAFSINVIGTHSTSYSNNNNDDDQIGKEMMFYTTTFLSCFVLSKNTMSSTWNEQAIYDFGTTKNDESLQTKKITPGSIICMFLSYVHGFANLNYRMKKDKCMPKGDASSSPHHSPLPSKFWYRRPSSSTIIPAIAFTSATATFSSTKHLPWF